MLGFKRFIKEAASTDAATGVYVSRGLDDASAEALEIWMHDNNIPRPVPTKLMHTTVVSSSVPLPELKIDKRSIRVKPNSYSFQRWPSGNGDTFALVLLFHSPKMEQQNRNARAMGARERYSFASHLTLTYNLPADFDWQALRPPPIYLQFEPEHAREYIDNWAVKKGLTEAQRIVKSFADYLSGGSAQPPLDFLNQVSGRADLGDIVVDMKRRLRTKTPYWMWSFYTNPVGTPMVDIDSGAAINVSARQDVIGVILSFLKQAVVTALCIPGSAHLDGIKAPGYRTQKAPNGDVWLVDAKVSPAAMSDYMRWDYGLPYISNPVS